LDDDEWWEEDPPPILPPLAMAEVTVTVTDNPITAELLGPNGKVLRQWRARPPFGFRVP
jgi:hypothetical protein